MPTVQELSAPYGNFMLGPRLGPGVCEICFDLTGGPPRCRHCSRPDPGLAAITPISYSVAHEQLHHALAGYKRPPPEVAERFQLELAAVLWRHLGAHERCLARAAGTTAFDLVTTVPSGRRERDDHHPLHRIVGELVGPARERFARVLERTAAASARRAPSVEKFHANRNLSDRSVLLIDDTWTTGASARSAAAALKAAGASTVAGLVLGRHLNREYRGNDQMLRALETPFDWTTCPRHEDR